MSRYLEERRRRMWGELPAPAPKPRKAIPKVSEKRKVLNKQYSAESVPFWKGKDCEIKAPGCRKKAQGIHHIWGKVNSNDLMDKSGWMRACNSCNTWVEANHAEAERLGFKKSRLNKRT